MPGTHPDAALASYTDGSATDEERHLAEAHLAECSTCRADVEFAAQGRAAVQSLPDLGSPGLVDEGLGWLPKATPETPIHTVRPGARRDRAARRPRRRPSPVSLRIAWGAGVAVAASLAAVFLFVGLNGGSQNATTAGGTAAPNAEAFGPVRSSKDYTSASVDALARTLAQKGGFQALTGRAAAAPASAAGGPVASPAAKALDQNAAKDEASCLRSGAGFGATVAPSYLEVATFQGKPAFVGAFRTGPAGASPTHLLVIAVDRVSCRALYVVTVPL